MDYIWQAIEEAIGLIIDLDGEVLQVVWASLRFSITSTILAAILGIPLGIMTSRIDFRGKSLVNIFLNTLLSMPTVVIGLLVYSFISRKGLFGEFALLFTSKGIILGQLLLILPLITALVRNAIHQVDQRLYETAISLGATKTQEFLLLLRETRYGIIGAIVAGYGRVIGEIGISMMLGGNIKGVTRTITTAIALETNKGRFSFGLALGLILLLISFVVNGLIYFLQAGDR